MPYSVFVKRHLLTVDDDGLAVEVDDKALIFKRMWLFDSLFGSMRLRTAQDSADPQEHLTNGERLGDVVVGTEVETRNLVILSDFGRKKDDGNILRGRILLELTGHSEPAHATHHHVEQYEPVAREVHLEGFLTRIGGIDLVALGLEVKLQNLTQVLFVVDSEEPRLVLIVHDCKIINSIAK